MAEPPPDPPPEPPPSPAPAPAPAQAPAQAPALTVRALVHHPGSAAPSLDVDVALGRGITCVLGPSGAGKSTLLGVIAGLVTPARGRVTHGDDVWLDTERGLCRPIDRRRVAYLFQHLALFPHLTARENVEYPMDRRQPRDARARAAHALLERLGVGHLATRRPRTFSGGEAQRVALARALAVEPAVVLFDEPFSALDRALKLSLVALVRRLADETRVPMIAVTHSHGEARALADRVLCLAGGRVTADGSAEALLPPHPVDD
jgi:molybdate transport system ATP-binding protein